LRHFVTSFIVFCGFASWSQALTYKTNIELGVGSQVLLADVCEDCLPLGSSISVASRFGLGKGLFFKPEAFYHFVSIDEDDRYGFSIRNHLIGMNLIMGFDFLRNHVSPITHRAEFESSVYGFIGGFHHNPYTFIDNQKVKLAPLYTENTSYSLFVPQSGVGISISKKLNSVRLGFKSDFSYLFSDYVDDISGEFIDAENFDPLRQTAVAPNGDYNVGDQRGINTINDLMVRFSVTLEFLVQPKYENSGFTF